VKSKVIHIIIFFIVISIFLLLLNENIEKIDGLPSLVYNSREYAPPETTPYGGFILSSPNKLLLNQDVNKNLLNYFLSSHQKKLDIKDYSFKESEIKINDSLVLKKSTIDYYDLPSREGSIISFSDNTFKIFLQLSRYNDNAYIFDPDYGYVFLFKRDLKRLWTGSLYDI